MLWITFVLALLITLGAFAFVVRPLVDREVPLLLVEDDRLTDLLARKDSALRALKDLEFDHQVGKISDDDFARLNSRLSRQAMSLLQQIERIAPEGQLLDEQLETEITKLRRVQATTRAEVAETPTAPTAVAAPAAAAPEAPTQFCTECGARVTSSFKFCANCGTPIDLAEAAPEK